MSLLSSLSILTKYSWFQQNKIIWSRNFGKMTSNPPPDPNRDNADSAGHAGLIDSIRKYLTLKLGFADAPTIAETPQAEVVLTERTLDGIVEWLLSVRCRNIITLAGAGISTAAGIPDFRSPGTGLYHNLQKYNLPNPQAIFDIEYFKHNPKPFYELARELFPGKFKPTISHYFIRLLHEKGLLLRHYTQNIDTLERVAGIPGNKLVEAHGSFETAHCLECHRQYDLRFIKAHIFRDMIPYCKDCRGIVKPDIVFFGESLPQRFQECLNEDFEKCDLLIIMGSSLEVQPFASLVDMVPDWCPRLLINREKAGVKPSLYSQFGINIGLQFDDGYRDVALLGNCDDGCMNLADKLCWDRDLRELVETEHKRLEKDGYHNLHIPESGSLPPYKPYVITSMPATVSAETSKAVEEEMTDLSLSPTQAKKSPITARTQITHNSPGKERRPSQPENHEATGNISVLRSKDNDRSLDKFTAEKSDQEMLDDDSGCVLTREQNKSCINHFPEVNKTK